MKPSAPPPPPGVQYRPEGIITHSSFDRPEAGQGKGQSNNCECKMAKKKSSNTKRSAGGSGGTKKGNKAKDVTHRANSSASLSSKTLASSALALFVAIALAGGFSGRSDTPLQGSNASNISPHSETLETDPWVDIVPDVIPPQVCNEIIYKSERIGYRLFPDSIDKGEPENLDQEAQEVYIYTNKKVVEPTLYALIEPHLPKLSNAIKSRGERLKGSRFADGQAFKQPNIEWMFLRKYYPLGKYSKRNSLKVHTDSNMHSITLALNDNYAGGGLFVVRPKVSDNNTMSTDEEEQNELHLPQVPLEYGGYKWLHEHKGLMRRENSSKVFFPHLRQGSAALINFTVPHGVAPTKDETQMPRYALIVFYDIDGYYRDVFPLIKEFQTSS